MEFRDVLDQSVEAQCRTYGFLPSGPMAERHGSWERGFTKRSGQLRRAVILAITQEGHQPHVDVELWIAADWNTWFVRRRVQAVQGLVDRVPMNLDAAVADAIAKADALTPADLKTKYPVIGQAHEPASWRGGVPAFPEAADVAGFYTEKSEGVAAQADSVFGHIDDSDEKASKGD